MTLFSRFVITVTIAGLPFLARGEGKCLDDPKIWKDGAGKDVLVVTWTIPFPAKAKIERDVGADVFAEVNKAAGSEIPAGFPKEHLSNVATVAYPSGTDATKVSSTPEELAAWEQQFGVTMMPVVMDVFRSYFQDNKYVYGTVVEHPALSNPVGYRFCTCTLQRAVVIWENGQEQLHVRSTFRSAKDPLNFVNFVPRSGLKFTFQSSQIWFPLKLNRVLPEPGAPAFLVLDVLTRTELPAAAIPGEFGVARRGTVTLGKTRYQFVRLTRRYDLGDPAPIEDLSLRAPR